jgi:anti-sigma regulatory factor (Ser/Thr protein kinase)
VSRQQDTTAVAAVPLLADGRGLGGFILYFDRLSHLDDAHREELVGLGHELATGLRRVQLGDGRRPRVPADGPEGVLLMVAEHEVAADPAAVSGARRFLRRTALGWGLDEDTADTAVLCVSELVTNSLIHTHAGCLVRVTLNDESLTTTVCDAGAAGAGWEAIDDPSLVHGRGLRLVEALASRWGSEADASGTAVWFALDVAERRSA